MMKWRRSILLVLAVLDFAVIGSLGYFVFIRRDASSNLPPAEIHPCAQIALANLKPHLSPVLAWEASTLTLTLTAFYDTPDPPTNSAQLLWDALDSLRRSVQFGCDLPTEITLVVQAHGQAHSVGHVTRLSGLDVTAWVNGDLTETELSHRSAYWRSDEITSDKVGH